MTLRYRASRLHSNRIDGTRCEFAGIATATVYIHIVVYIFMHLVN